MKITINELISLLNGKLDLSSSETQILENSVFNCSDTEVILKNQSMEPYAAIKKETYNEIIASFVNENGIASIPANPIVIYETASSEEGFRHDEIYTLSKTDTFFIEEKRQYFFEAPSLHVYGWYDDENYEYKVNEISLIDSNNNIVYKYEEEEFTYTDHISVYFLPCSPKILEPGEYKINYSITVKIGDMKYHKRNDIEFNYLSVKTLPQHNIGID